MQKINNSLIITAITLIILSFSSFNAIAAGKLEGIYRNYISAMEAKNVTNLKKYMLIEKVKEMEDNSASMGGMDAVLTMMSQMLPKDLKNIKEEVKDNEAFIHATGPGMFSKESKTTISFKKESDVWKVNEVSSEETN